MSDGLLQPAIVVDVALLWALSWYGIRWLRTSTARNAVAVLAIVGFGAAIARAFDLIAISRVLQAVAGVSVLIVVVVFQQELRRLIDQITSLRFRSASGRAAPSAQSELLIRALAALAEQRRGALVVVPGLEPLERHLDGGIELDARLSEPLVLSLFDPHSPGHDGAVVYDGTRLRRFAVHLPLSTDHAQLGQRGTRHAAALGLSERSDALCLVVSEERGTVSVALGGHLETLPSAQAAGDRLASHLRGLSSEGQAKGEVWWRSSRTWREGVLSLAVAALAWWMIVPGGGEIEVDRSVALRITGLPAGYALERIDPDHATVRFRARRRDLFLMSDEDFEVRVDALLAELGRRTFAITPADVIHPEAATILSLEPSSIKIDLTRTTMAPDPR